MHAAIRENALMRALRLRRVDRTLTLLLTAYFFFALTSVTIVKSLQKGIYLGTIGFDWQLPALYLVLALLSSPIVFLYRYLARHYSHILITTFTLLILGAGMTLFMLGRNHAESWAYHAFYLWAAVFSVLVPTQGWIFSYHLFTSRQAKRTFVIMGTGGILGGVVGGYYTAAVAGFFTANGLFIHVLVLLALMEAVLLGVFWHGKKKRLRSSRGARPDQKSERPQLFQAVLRSRHLGYLAGLILLTGLVSTLIDLQFNWSLDDRFTDAEIPITQFVGGLQGTIYLLSALVQLFGTSQILHRFGLGLGLMILPLGLITGSLGMMFTANFWSVVTAKTFDGSLRSSIEQTSVELLYVPLSQRESIPVKSFVELVILRVGDGLGAALFLLVASFFSPPLQAVGIVVLLVCIVWLFTSQQIAEEYSKMLRRSLEDMDSRTVRRALEISEAVAENTLVGALQSKNSNKVHFALQQLRFQDAEPGLQEISSNDLSGEVLSMDVSGIYQFSSRAPRWLKYVEPLTEHADRRVGAVAIHLMMTYKVPGHFERLVARMQSTEVPEDRYLTYLQEYAEDPNELLRSKYLLHWCGVARPEQCVNLAFLLGVTRNPTYVLTLRDWLNSPHRNLQKAAMRALGEFGEPQDIDTLMRFLAHNWSRRAAIKALTRYGEKIVSTMLTQLRNPKVDIAIKREIPSVLSQIDSSSARGVLVAALYTHDSVVAYRALKGLNLIRD
ncbi:MAG: HEAT repeat domain-containing protein, partial [Acidobacteriota bacterium]